MLGSGYDTGLFRFTSFIGLLIASHLAKPGERSRSSERFSLVGVAALTALDVVRPAAAPF